MLRHYIRQQKTVTSRCAGLVQDAPVPAPDIDFHRIRPYGDPPSRAGGFEELASILIRDGVVSWPAGTRFARFGNPDGGREGTGTLPSGEVWAWQAKYLFEFDASAARQVSESIARAMDREPTLRRYFVALPLDRPAGDGPGRTSAHTRWTQKVADWTQLAKDRGLDVEFEFVGAHELLTALTEPRHEGRARYWFTTDILSPPWQRLRVEETVAKVGPRYSPELHVDVDPVRALEAVARTDGYVARWRTVLAALRRARRWPWRAPEAVAQLFDEALIGCAAALDAADDGVQSMITAATGSGPLPALDAALSEAAVAVGHVQDLLREHCRTRDGYYVDVAATLHSELRAAGEALYGAEELATSGVTRAAADKRVVVVGRAGVGKTHLLCDVARRRLAAGRPTLVLLGQDFDRRPLLGQVGELTQLGGSPEHVLATLDAAAQASGHIGVVMVDALNESEREERWRDELRVLRLVASRFPHIALVVACRTEFVDAVLGDDDSVRVEHDGFGETVDEAVARFTREYGLEPPTFPVLDPEFTTPLYLKLTCEALTTLGAKRFPFGTTGLVTVCTAYLRAVNVRLAEPDWCDYDVHRDLVGQAVARIARLGRGPYDRTQVEQITQAALPDRAWSRSLMRGLIAEGVLNEVSRGRIVFGYQRLGDVERALAVTGNGLDGVRAWLQATTEDGWRERGVLGALTVIVAEQYGTELADLAADESGAVSYAIIDSFLESLLLRSPTNVTPRAVEIVERLLTLPAWQNRVWRQVVRTAPVPGHALNADWLHRVLTARTLPERDASWSTWLVDAVGHDDASAVDRLIRWAWPAELDARGAVPDEVAVLVMRVLGWMLTCSDRRVRDRATKAIVSVGERAPRALGRAVASFRSIDDPYVIERLVGAAAGVVLRIDDADAVHAVADGVAELLADGWPTHLLTRDYARRVYAAAAASGWTEPHGQPPDRAAWPVPTRSIDEIEALTGTPGGDYSSIWFSLTGLSDFGHKTLRTALHDVATDDERGLRHTAERVIFDRVLALGWTPQRFADVDRGRAGGRESPVERIGQKYRWIAFYETLGRIADTLPLRGTWPDGPPQPYDHAEQLIWRDIDPTVLARKPAVDLPPATPWFAPVGATFPEKVVDAYPADMDGVPDPLELLVITAPDGTTWLTLIGNYEWEQQLLPELTALGAPHHQTWMQVHAYLVAAADADGLATWAKGKDWFGRWMPDAAEPHNLLLGVHPDDPRWSSADGTVDWWGAGRGKRPPAQLWQCAAWYAGTGTSRDASAAQETRGYVPSRKLFDVLALGRGVDFAWPDRTKMTAVHDPSIVLGGPPTLAMRCDLVPRLHEAGLTLFWTVLVGKELVRPDHHVPDDHYRWVSASASYLLTADKIEQIDTLASRCRPGPDIENRLNWTTRPSFGLHSRC